MEELSRTKDSVDSRATFVIGIPGVILSVFVGVFISFWTSQQIPGLARTDPFLVFTALLLTIGVVVSLLGAVAIGLSILTPKSFDLGMELGDAYQVAHDPTFDTPGLKEASLRALISSFTGNLPTYYRNVFRYNIASLLVVVSLTYASEFVGIVILTSNETGPMLRIAISWVALAFSGLVLLVALHRLWRNWKSGLSVWAST